MTHLFVSDLHLDAAAPEASNQFIAWLRGDARLATALYILGDLFESWVGDDDDDAERARVCAALHEYTAGGVPCFVMHGNRDFLLGERFARATGARLLPEYEVIDLHGVRTLLCHGDVLCTDDVEYQSYRARMRDPDTQRRLLRLPYFLRRMMARWMQRRSADSKSGKAEAIMDVTPDAVAAAFRAHDAQRMIHGHTHRPARHVHAVDGSERERIVLADWYDGGSYLEVDAGGATVRSLRGE